MTNRPEPRTPRCWPGGDTAVLGAGIVACAVCCAGPLLALLAAIGVTSAVAAVVVPGFALITIVACGGVWWLRRRARARCAPQPSVTDLDPAILRRAEPTADHRTAGSAVGTSTPSPWV